MEQILNLWGEFEEWYAYNYSSKLDEILPVIVPTPSFAQFMAWYRDIYPLKTTIAPLEDD